MPFDFDSLREYLLPVAFLAGGVIGGLIVEKIVLYELRKLTNRTKGELDNLAIRSLHGMPLLWLTLAGIYGAINNVDMRPGLLSFLQQALLVAAIASLTWATARFLVGFVNHYSAKVGGPLLSTSMFANLTRIIVFIVGGLIILQSLGVSVTPLLTALGVGSLAVALALQDTLSNLFAGIHIIASQQVRPGDYVQLDSAQEGYVTDITWRYTTIRALPNNMVIIPNSKLASAIVTNFYNPETQMAVRVPVGVNYASDLDRVEEISLAVARETMREVPGGIPDFEPVLRFHTFGESSIDFNVIMRCREFTDQFVVRHEFVKRLHRRYRAEGIEIPFPIRTVHLQKEK
ncbi:MAG TPA: mechanosensitive ion channel family protein [Syntrophales bacterium]|nr:mechanosensitive ion channel family protein [Syntrophales bacterium]HPX82133.1 mechanosensitive ion channel family protein [Syntrophales bacterium]